MPIALDATSQGNILNSATLTVAHTCTGTDRILVVGVSNFKDPGPVGTVTATYNSVAMTSVDTQTFGAGLLERVTLFYLLQPALGSNNIVITSSTTSNEIELGATSWTGVLAVGSSAKTSIANAVSISVAVPSATDELVVDEVSWFNQTITIGADQTQRILIDNGATQDSLAMSSEPGSATVTMSWSWATNESAGQIAVALQPVTSQSRTPIVGVGVLSGTGSVLGLGLPTRSAIRGV